MCALKRYFYGCSFWSSDDDIGRTIVLASSEDEALEVGRKVGLNRGYRVLVEFADLLDDDEYGIECSNCGAKFTASPESVHVATDPETDEALDDPFDFCSSACYGVKWLSVVAAVRQLRGETVEGQECEVTDELVKWFKPRDPSTLDMFAGEAAAPEMPEEIRSADAAPETETRTVVDMLTAFPPDTETTQDVTDM